MALDQVLQDLFDLSTFENYSDLTVNSTKLTYKNNASNVATSQKFNFISDSLDLTVNNPSPTSSFSLVEVFVDGVSIYSNSLSGNSSVPISVSGLENKEHYVELKIKSEYLLVREIIDFSLVEILEYNENPPVFKMSDITDELAEIQAILRVEGVEDTVISKIADVITAIENINVSVDMTLIDGKLDTLATKIDALRGVNENILAKFN